MVKLLLHEFHGTQNARFAEVNGSEAVADYGDVSAEETALSESAGMADLSYRGRLCVLGADRAKFLNGQVTNNVKDLQSGQGCYAAIVSAKGKIQSDLHVYILENEILLEFEPGMTGVVQQRLEKYIIAEDAQIADVSEHYGLWTLQGPAASDVIKKALPSMPLPGGCHAIAKVDDPALGELYLARRVRSVAGGFDLFVPNAAMRAVAELLLKTGARPCGWDALEIARIEAGIPRYGVDMDESNLAPEAIDAEAISYSKGCYIGQEVIARVRTYGHVNKTLRRLRLPGDLPVLPAKGARIYAGEKEAGQITSAIRSTRKKEIFALGYIRREAHAAQSELLADAGPAKALVKIVDAPAAA